MDNIQKMETLPLLGYIRYMDTMGNNQLVSLQAVLGMTNLHGVIVLMEEVQLPLWQ